MRWNVMSRKINKNVIALMNLVVERASVVNVFNIIWAAVSFRLVFSLMM